MKRALASLSLVLAVLSPAGAQEPARTEPIRIIVGHSRVYSAPEELRLIRVAVGNADRVRVRVPTPKQILLNARVPGRTNLIVWFDDGSREEVELVVERDLGPLHTRLAVLAPEIRVETSNDGNALILTGSAPSLTVMQAAVEVASAFAAGQRPVSERAGQFLLVQVGKENEDAGAPDAASAGSEVLPTERAPGGVSVINLLTLTTRTSPQEERLQAALGRFAHGIVVERLQTGLIPGDADTFVLKGTLPDAGSYLELLTTAVRSLGGDLGSLRILGEEGAVSASALANALDRGAVVVGHEGRLVSHLRSTAVRMADPGSPEAQLETELRRITTQVQVERLPTPGGDTFVLRGTLDDPDLYRELLSTAVRLLGSPLDSLHLAEQPPPVDGPPGLTGAQLSDALLHGLTVVGARGRLLSFVRSRQSPSMAALVREVGRVAPSATVRVIGLRGQETYLLEGTVPDPPTYVRLLALADRILGGDGRKFTVVADAGGGLVDGAEDADDADSGGGNNSLSGLGGGFGGGGQTLRKNDLARNVGRGLIVSNTIGNLVSMLRVDYIPQAMISVRIVEVNRSRLRAIAIDGQMAWPDFDGAGLGIPFPGGGPIAGVGPGPGVGNSTDVLDVLRILSGEARNEFALVNDKFAFDVVVRALEQEGHVKTLAEPTLVTLSGETANFFVGGAAAVSNVVATNVSATTGFNFLPFGISLAVRPVVGEDRQITIDVAPTVSELEPTLAQTNSLGAARPPIFSALRSRTLRTSARLGADQGLVLGGIITRSESQDVRKLPFLGDIPLLGLLFRDTVSRTEEREIVIVVFPELVRPQDRRLLEFDLPRNTLRVGAAAKERAGE